jgi:hypothetical protein
MPISIAAGNKSVSEKFVFSEPLMGNYGSPEIQENTHP